MRCRSKREVLPMTRDSMGKVAPFMGSEEWDADGEGETETWCVTGSVLERDIAFERDIASIGKI